jgi:hypothetical protein
MLSPTTPVPVFDCPETPDPAPLVPLNGFSGSAGTLGIFVGACGPCPVTGVPVGQFCHGVLRVLKFTKPRMGSKRLPPIAHSAASKRNLTAAAGNYLCREAHVGLVS